MSGQDYVRVACVCCEHTTGTPLSSIWPCSPCGGVEFVSFGPWRPTPGLYSVQQLFERGQIDFEAVGGELRANDGWHPALERAR